MTFKKQLLAGLQAIIELTSSIPSTIFSKYCLSCPHTKISHGFHSSSAAENFCSNYPQVSLFSDLALLSLNLSHINCITLLYDVDRVGKIPASYGL